MRHFIRLVVKDLVKRVKDATGRRYGMMGQKKTGPIVKFDPDLGMNTSSFSFVGPGADIIWFCLRHEYHYPSCETFMDPLLMKFADVHNW